MNPCDFFAELMRRNVYKVAIAYAVVGWLLIQVATQVFPFFDIPNWVVRLVVLVILLGFPIALVIAWAFELTPKGLKRTETADAEPQLGRRRKGAWLYVALIAGAVSIGLFFVGRYTAQETESAATAGSAKSITVLPFENLSADKIGVLLDPLRNDPGFQKLIADGEAAQAQDQNKP
jgi:TRAP-type C4-dicarboxylate transport system permease small subunit